MRSRERNLLHVLVRLGHFCKVVIRPLGGDAVFVQQRQRCKDGCLSLTVAERQERKCVIICWQQDVQCLTRPTRLKYTMLKCNPVHDLQEKQHVVVTYKNISLWKSSSTPTSPLVTSAAFPSILDRMSSAGGFVMSSLSTQGRSLRKSARHCFSPSCGMKQQISQHILTLCTLT